MSGIVSGGIRPAPAQDKIARTHYDAAGKPISSEQYWAQWEKKADAQRAKAAAQPKPSPIARWFCCNQPTKK